MIGVIRLAGHLLARHWPSLLAWYLAGTLGRYVVIQVAGFVGAYNGLFGYLLLPLAILCRLIAFVAMLLVVRDGMRELTVLAPLPEERATRRKAFVDALLGGILPFFAFYAAWGYLREDAAAYTARALEVNKGLIAQGMDQPGVPGELSLSVWTVALIVLAFAGRWAWKRYRERLPRALAVGAVYLEALWVFFSVILIADILGAISGWVGSRQAMVWLGDVRETITAGFAPLAFIWEAVEWLLGEAGGIILLPVAWLTIAGVIYGQAVAPQTVRLSGKVVTRAKARWDTVPSRLRARGKDLWSDLVGRFTPIGRALVLMWRAGPVLIGSYVLLYTVLLWLEGWLSFGALHAFGPQDLYSFWLVNDALILAAVPLIVEPLRIALVASSYDGVIGRLVPGQGSRMIRANSGASEALSRSTENGPEASSGTM